MVLVVPKFRFFHSIGFVYILYLLIGLCLSRQALAKCFFAGLRYVVPILHSPAELHIDVVQVQSCPSIPHEPVRPTAALSTRAAH